jgi:hypothetical protein
MNAFHDHPDATPAQQQDDSARRIVAPTKPTIN